MWGEPSVLNGRRCSAQPQHCIGIQKKREEKEQYARSTLDIIIECSRVAGRYVPIELHRLRTRIALYTCRTVEIRIRQQK